MDLVEVRIKGTVITAQYGTLTSGDILRTSAAYAKHIVEDCGAGVYVAGTKQDAEPQDKPARKRKE